MKNILNLSLFLLFLSSFVACKNDKAAKTETSAKVEASAKTGKTYIVDQTLSKVLWEGTKPAGAHNGTVDVSSGSISVANGTITGGAFAINMNTITVLDLEGDKKAYLEGHLKGLDEKSADDFFNVNKYPMAKFEITKVTKLENDPAGSHLVYGNLTIRDVTKQIGIKANVSISDNTVSVKAPTFKIDRTEWGIKYHSGKFFDNLKDKVINDDLNMGINLVARA